MKNNFKRIKPQDIDDNTFSLIGDDWMLITAGSPDSFNTMTASWGMFGILWNLPVTLCFIRPQRYTFGFAEHSDHYTLSFFNEEFRDALRFCGSKSGRDFNKPAETGLIPFTTANKSVAFEQARLILECKKLYSDNLKEDSFIIRSIASKNYRTKDYHRFYIGEIVNAMIKE